MAGTLLVWPKVDVNNKALTYLSNEGAGPRYLAELAEAAAAEAVSGNRMAKAKSDTATVRLKQVITDEHIKDDDGAISEAATAATAATGTSFWTCGFQWEVDVTSAFSLAQRKRSRKQNFCLSIRLAL